MKPDPMGEDRNPFQVYLLCLAVFSGLSIVGTDVPATVGSVEYYLDGWSEAAWGWLLILGGGTSLVGMYWPWDPRDGLLLKRIGFATLSVPVIIYALVILAVFGVKAVTLAAIISGLGVASAIQWHRVSKRIKGIIDRTEEAEAAEAEEHGDDS